MTYILFHCFHQVAGSVSEFFECFFNQKTQKSRRFYAKLIADEPEFFSIIENVYNGRIMVDFREQLTLLANSNVMPEIKKMLIEYFPLTTKGYSKTLYQKILNI